MHILTVLLILLTASTATAAETRFARDKRLAEGGDLAAMNAMGEYYYQGRYVSRDHEASRAWFARAAGLGDAQAQYRLGVFLVDGVVGTVTPAYAPGEFPRTQYATGEGLAWLEKAAAQDHIPALRKLSSLYLDGGRGMEPDVARGMEYCSRAAALGDPESQFWLAYALSNPERYRRRARYGLSVDEHDLEPDYGRAAALYLQAANQGHAQAQNNLGLLYEQGLGVKKDGRRAVYWYSKSAEQDNGNAVVNLARIYEGGLYGVKTDRELSAAWYRRAAAGGTPAAQYILCIRSLFADGDQVGGLAWCEKAAAQGYKPAQAVLAGFYSGLGRQEEARAWGRQVALPDGQNRRSSARLMNSIQLERLKKTIEKSR